MNPNLLLLLLTINQPVQSMRISNNLASALFCPAEMAETYPIKGIPTQDPNGRPYVRKDIDQWYREQVDPWRSNGIQLTLFVHALAAIQKRTVKNKLSYFRLAGIHSAPWCPWDGEYNSTTPSDDSDRIPGFCVHNNYTFPTWHRVYMLLYEVRDI